MYKPKEFSGLSHLECDQRSVQEFLGLEDNENVGVTSRAVLRGSGVIWLVLLSRHYGRKLTNKPHQQTFHRGDSD